MTHHVINLDPLLMQLDQFSTPPGTKLDIPGDDKRGYIEPLRQFINHKGWPIWSYERTLVELMSIGPAGWLHALKLMDYRGRIGGVTCHTSDPNLLPNFTMFDYDYVSHNTQVLIVAHEIGHVLTPKHIADPTLLDRNRLAQNEAIAYGVQYGVATALGLDTRIACLGGLKGYGVTAEMLHGFQPLVVDISSEVLQWVTIGTN